MNQFRPVLAAALAVMVVGLLACTQKPEYAITLEAPAEVTHKLSAGILTIPVKITNRGGQVISSKRSDFLSFHLHGTDGKKSPQEGNRTEIPDVMPGATVLVSLSVAILKAPGDYMLAVDIVREHVTWYVEKGNQEAVVKLRVQP